MKWLESAGNDNDTDNDNDNDNVNKNDNDIGNNDVDDENQMVWLYDRVETILLLLWTHIVCVLGGLSIGATIRTPQEVEWSLVCKFFFYNWCSKLLAN